MFTQRNRDELETLGVTVVEGVISESECHRHQENFRTWLDTFPVDQWPMTTNSLIQRYKSGHLQPAWEVRLAAKPVFSQLWGTEKLLSSMDAIAIGRPPETSSEKFWEPDDNWLHVDQTADRVGLHAYQGAVYLEECAEDDWTFEVVDGSHKYFDEFLDMTRQWRCRKLSPRDIRWFEAKGCRRRRVPCPKGGLILWDSRLFHANARPVKGRLNPGRWRFVVFVCMTPASWASENDLALKRKAYAEMRLTTHWPSQEVFLFSTHVLRHLAQDPNSVDRLPEAAQSDEAKRLVGILSYPDKDEDETGFRPVWDKEKWATFIEDFKAGNDRGARRDRQKTKIPFKA
ncbi:unnamed protein product [Lymnaea stagnalis]|uniref:Phytanoyl-CoA dioxygenase n=1 Tax=Lymnaea stagnalis TaxID=6523 RepID=A0AAV2I805_LYMST